MKCNMQFQLKLTVVLASILLSLSFGGCGERKQGSANEFFLSGPASPEMESLGAISERLRTLEYLRNGDTDSAINYLELMLNGDILESGTYPHSNLISTPHAPNILVRLEEYIEKHPPQTSDQQYQKLLNEALVNLQINPNDQQPEGDL